MLNLDKQFLLDLILLQLVVVVLVEELEIVGVMVVIAFLMA